MIKIITIPVLVWFRRLVVLWMTMLFFASQPTPCSFAQEISTAQENQIKVSYIYNFTKFVKWPDDETDKSRRDNFPICLMGGGSLGGLLDHLSKTKKIKNKTITILKNPLLGELKTCKVLFIDSSNSDRLYSILANLKSLHVLTIGDTEGYARRGVGINMFDENNKIRFEINRKVLFDAGLIVSSELLKLGVPVVSEN